MEQFLGLSRDASREKSEAGTSPYNRNVVIDKQLGSITQENGFVLHKELRGIVIGVHSTNTHIIYITYLTTNGNTLISYVNMDNDELVEIIDTSYFNYSPERPIEIVAWYNYNQDLIIMFSDGVFANSSAPRIINLMETNNLLDINKEFISEKAADSTYLFSIINLPLLSVSYGNKSNHNVDVLFFTVAYVLPDGITRTRFIPSLVEAFPIYAFSNEYKRDVSFNIKDLDLFFNQIVIGIIAYKDNAITGYITDPLSINDTNFTYNFTGVETLKVTSVEEIAVESIIYNKIKSLTIGNDTIIAGGLINNIQKSYQKYANLLQLQLYFDDRKDNRHQAPLLCPDEVYFMTIAVAFNNGTFSEEYHIPGPIGTVDDVFPINKVELGLQTLNGDIPKFKVVNKGGWKNPSVGLPNFNNLDETELTWGYWQNNEVYPNNDNYNSLVDYDGITPLPNGVDNRGRAVRLHRVPGLDMLSEKIPMRLGMDIKNEDNPIIDYHTRLPAFAIKLSNFTEVFQNVIESDNIIGYRLSFAKKDSSSKIVEDINFIKPLVIKKDFDLAETVPFEGHYQINKLIGTNYPNTGAYKYYQFGFSNIKSINMSNYKGSLSPKIVKANYGIFNERTPDFTTDENKATLPDKSYRDLENDTDTKGTVGRYSNTIQNASSPLLPYELLNFRIQDVNHKYAVIQSIEQSPGNNKDKNNLFSHERIKLRAKNNNATPAPAETINPLGYNFGWNPLKYNPTSLLDNTTPITINAYVPSVTSFSNFLVDSNNMRRINLCTTMLNIKDDIHTGLQPKSFVVIGHTNIDNSTKVFKDFGDTFSNNIYNDIYENFFSDIIVLGSSAAVSYHQQIYSGMLAIDNNTLVSFIKDKTLGATYLFGSTPNAVDKLLAFNLTKKIYNKPSTKQLNNIIANIAFNYNKKYVNKFPYRIIKSLTIQSENLSTYNVRTFLANAYYDLASIRGEVTYLVGFDKGVYCQQRFSLSIFQLKEKLSNNDENTAYLAETDLFAYKPSPIVDEDNKGYIGSVHQFAKKLSKDGLVTIDAERGKVYLIAGATPKELSKIKMTNFFKDVLSKVLNTKVATLFNPNAPIDNPYNSNGVLIGIDDKTNRILITINNYTPLLELPEGVEFRNGIPYLGDSTDILDIKNSLYTTNNCNTLSFNLDWQRWFSEHDYYPQFYVNTNQKNYAGINIIATNNLEKSLVYITNNNKAKAGKYFYELNNTIFESYTDLLFNSRYDLSKWYKSVMWRSTVKDINDNNIEEATIDAVLLYTDYQCSGRIELDTDVVSLIRNSEGLWSFNSFRDLAKNGNDLPIRKDGSYDEQKIYLNRNWFDKSDFISNFIIVRLIMNNIEDTQTHIHNVNTEARISDRI